MDSLREIFDRFYKKVEEIRPSFTLSHCCETMDKGMHAPKSIYVYFAKDRQYGFLIRKTTGCMPIDYCIHCGTKMPDRLRKKWFFILRTKYHLSYDDLEDDTKIPPEFLTEEWWRQRNIPNKLSYLSKRERENKQRRKRRNGCFCLDDGKELNKYCQSNLIYNTRFREYGIKAVRQRGPYTPMIYCLWCGRQLEPSLRDLWAKLLQKEHNIAKPFKTPITQLPKSFRTDEWWKRRGL
jgi:hypothetical protein